MTHLLLTVRWLDDRYHGLLDRNGPQEWPPSPFRLFQALVAGVAQRGELDFSLGLAFGWLQKLKPPVIITPQAKGGQPITRFVPNNDGDEKFDREKRLTAKLTMPMLLLDRPEILYLWEIRDIPNPPIIHIRNAARCLVCLGWGIDMAFADARTVSQTEVKSLQGIRWYPKPDVWRDEGMLRTPTYDPVTKQNTLYDLMHCYETAMNRIEHGKPLKTVDKPKVFKKIFYASIERPISRPYVVFELRDDDGMFFRYPQSKLIHIAGMVRHLAIETMKNSPPEGIPEDWIEKYVAGHISKNGPKESLDESYIHRQFSYIPLPSIGYVHTDPSIRRVMIVAPLGDDRYLEYLARRLEGAQLIPTSETKIKTPPTLVRVRHDKVAHYYTQPANIWASVTPVILPGHDDHKPEKTCKLIEKALAQAGIEQACEYEWSAVSFFPKSLTAHKNNREKKIQGYWRPDYLQSLTAVHLILRFKDNVKATGPLAIGAGRHCGLGIFAAADALER
ncbi:MAG: type I-U CRISPR-associated protein Csb2 [Candidatus Omnitrophota bacterium]